MKKIFTFLIAALFSASMWGYVIIRNPQLNGDTGDDWTNTDAMTQVDESSVYYKTYTPTATTDLYFRIGTGSEWNTEQNANGIDNSHSNITLINGGGDDQNVKFQVPESVPVTIYYDNSSKNIWIKVESYKTDVLDGKAMFYYGFTTDWGDWFAHFFEDGNKKFGGWAVNSYANKDAKLAIGVCEVNGTSTYSATNNNGWSGPTHTGMAGGDQIYTYNDGENKCQHVAADQFSFGTTAEEIVVGQTIASFPEIDFTGKKSGVGAVLSLEGYYYSTAASGQTWTDFTPGTTESTLAAGIYYIKALGTDDAIYMASSDYITLTVKDSPTAIDNTEAGNAAVKRLVNGQLVIEKNGKTFNAIGTEIK